MFRRKEAAMPLDVGYDEIVRILTLYYSNHGQDLVDEFGEQGPSLAGEMGEVLGERLNSDTPFGQMWAEYKRNPEYNEDELIGALEMLEEAMPELTIRLEGYYAAFQKLVQPGVRDVMETSEPEDTINIEELKAIKSTDDMDNDDEYREENEYLTGNTEDRSTSAMYYEGLDTDIEPNQTEE
jgi:hypothetical protein